MRAYLLRHTSVDVTPGLCYGAKDVPVNATWRDEGLAALEHIPEAARGHAPVFSSDLSRCAKLASLFGRDVTHDARLREMSFGEWEGRLWSDLPRSVIDLWSDNLESEAPPGGEAFAAVSRRVLECVDEIVASQPDDGEVIIVTHGGPLRCIAARVLGMPLAESVRLVVGYAGVASVRFEPDLDRLEFWNR